VNKLGDISARLMIAFCDLNDLVDDLRALAAERDRYRAALERVERLRLFVNVCWTREGETMSEQILALGEIQERLRADRNRWYDNAVAERVRRVAAEAERDAARAERDHCRAALEHERSALALVRDRQCHDGICRISLADLQQGIALLDAALGPQPKTEGGKMMSEQTQTQTIAHMAQAMDVTTEPYCVFEIQDVEEGGKLWRRWASSCGKTWTPVENVFDPSKRPTCPACDKPLRILLPAVEPQQ